ncbi:SDR family oxidoreductase [Bacteriovoracales bacterium]|nr:SDR family oxidoreductase [Bacteriovoracales bacterium]
MNLNLEGKTFFVSGSTQGIGLGIAKGLLEEGANVILNGRDQEKYESIKINLIGNHEFISGDVSEQEGSIRVFSFLEEKESLDGLVCNVGSGSSVPPGQETQSEWERVLKTNFFSATNLIEKCLPLLKKSGGNIICISSICGQAALGAPLTYSASKAALNSYIKGLARVVGKDGIRVNAIAPGNIIFPGSVWERKTREDNVSVQKMLEKEVALKRLGGPEEIAHLACFLSSAKASFITGSLVVADGGQLRS